jgi:hypothetical protein
MYRIALVFSVGVALHAQWIHQPTPGIPRTPDGKPNLTAPAPKLPDGKPDLSGLWNLFQSGGGVATLKPPELSSWAKSIRAERQEDLAKDHPSAKCLPLGFTLFGMYKLVQTPGLILLLGEDLTYRQIFTDGRALPQDPNPAWMGYSVGHWESDTLVVESNGYNERTWLDQNYPHSEDLRITERFHRTDFGHMEVNMTFTDPKISEKPWTTKVGGLISPDTELIEYVCAENEKDAVHLVGKESDDKKKAVKVAPEILSRYAGVYEFSGKDFGVTVPVLPVNINLEDGALKLGFGGASQEEMIPLSETTFSSAGGHVEFGTDGKGSYMILKIAEGDFRGNRKN